jgi:acetoacetyl-CoA synthetase
MGAYLRWLETERGLAFADYDAAWRWSVDAPGAFWRSILDYFAVRLATPPSANLASAVMPGATWFPDATLNWAEHVLTAPGRAGTDEILVAVSQTRGAVTLTVDELRDQVARCRAGLKRLGVQRGDRVAAYLPNAPEAVIALLATASIGAVWTACAPEFGTRAVVDRLAQVEPVVLLAVDGYRYGDRVVDRADEVQALRAALPSVRTTVVVPYLRPADEAAAAVPGTVPWSSLFAEPASLAFDPVPFDHPLWVLYSSGTTGLPKAIVHGHGGILLEHLKALALHTDLGPADRFCWYTTTGWMMWNYLVSAPAVGATIVLFDGNPAWPDLSTLWRLAADQRITYLGVSAPFIAACRAAGLVPGRNPDAAPNREPGGNPDPALNLDLAALRGVGSTGAPLPPAGFHWVRDAVSASIPVGSLSGGTDVCTGFLGPSPLVPVWAGEISCRMLGAKVEAFDEDGRSVVGRQGELVITAPMPSMPVRFWNDPDGSRLRAAYFEAYPGAWRHGDWLTITERGSCVLTGRSDATLNRGGVRIGTAELYGVVEAVPGIADSLVVHLEDAAGGPGELFLFVTLRDGVTLDEALRSRLAAELRAGLSPRHVPDAVHAVPAIPRTLNGKKLEVPVKRILQGKPPDEVASRDALADPGALAPFEALAAERRVGRRA